MRQPNERQHDGEPEISVWTMVPVGFLILLSIGVVIGGILKATRFGPAVGDIVSFDVAAAGFDQAPVTVSRADAAIGEHSCVLRPRTLVNGGGSLVIEGRELGQRGAFRVHWAGPRTSPGGEDCGRSAELLVSPNDLVTLAASAGGFGVGHKKLIMSSSSLSASTAMVE